ncbi:RusA family crossover junction endodeoxyribonuclease [Gordonia sp. PDNC005]|uniref:RusA family crossover junction endodeoxyribonuclease n=1 Tax=Gordonia sp. PDNC005 TaxID=2811424 RepID=UPI0019645A39|nr:RusA family crossover junction endodeoxyribonuclease [Gordonia sp. PDNC005]QRY61494.1 RusA family crossover junction endodeoxyribonuclease [Gordonia sp. PDNC005]
MPDRHVFVVGRPAPQGSKSPKGRTKSGRVILVESSKYVGPWRQQIAASARRRGGILPPGPVSVSIGFVMPRPQGTPKRASTPPAVKRPDVDKLARAVLDAITGVWIADDSHVVALHATKRIAELGEPSGAAITVNTIHAGIA